MSGLSFLNLHMPDERRNLDRRRMILMSTVESWLQAKEAQS